MKRALPLWIAAAVPSTIAGHALAYAASGQTASDARHAWLQPALEISLAIAAAACAYFLAQSLVRAGILVHTSCERSYLALWPRLAAVQIALYTAVEFAEGVHPNLTGWGAQILTALLAALLLALFARFLAHCVAGTLAASRYLQRLLNDAAPFVTRRPAPIPSTLPVSLGTARFQRPPPRK